MARDAGFQVYDAQVRLAILEFGNGFPPTGTPKSTDRGSGPFALSASATYSFADVTHGS